MDGRGFEAVATCAGMEGIFRAPSREIKIGAVMIAGSGPTDANGANPISGRNDKMRMLAAALAANGVASLRYDKRGVAHSAAGAPPEEQMTLDASVEDAGLWVDWLREALPGCPVALIGHSEGALIACMTARTRAIAALVLLTGIGRRLEAVIAEQIAANIPEPFAAKARATLAELAAGRRVASVDPALAALFRPSVQPYLISSLTRDPAAELAAFEGPALIVGGGRDMQVSRADFDRLSAANARATTLWLEAMNHVLKDVGETRKANRAAYADPTPPLASGLSGAISAFLLAPGVRRRTKSFDAATNRDASGLSIMLNPFESGSLR